MEARERAMGQQANMETFLRLIKEMGGRTDAFSVELKRSAEEKLKSVVMGMM